MTKTPKLTEEERKFLNGDTRGINLKGLRLKKQEADQPRTLMIVPAWSDLNYDGTGAGKRKDQKKP